MAWLHETFKGEDLSLASEVSTRMCADIYTKALVDAEKFKSACYLIGVCDDKGFNELAKRSHEWENPRTRSGGKKDTPSIKEGAQACAICGDADPRGPCPAGGCAEVAVPVGGCPL